MMLVERCRRRDERVSRSNLSYAQNEKWCFNDLPFRCILGIPSHILHLFYKEYVEKIVILITSRFMYCISRRQHQRKLFSVI